MVPFIFAFGVMFWTLAEYFLHRFMGHIHKGRNFFKTEHVQHHSRANYFAPAYKKAIGIVVLSGILFFILSLFVAKILAFAFLAGFFGMAALYETTHFRYHATDPLVAPFIILRKHHFYHHFHNPQTNFGVTTRFWDRVFGTFTAVEKVTVPKAMAMDWLTEGADIKSVYADHFCFRVTK